MAFPWLEKSLCRLIATSVSRLPTLDTRIFHEACQVIPLQPVTPSDWALILDLRTQSARCVAARSRRADWIRKSAIRDGLLRFVCTRAGTSLLQAARTGHCRCTRTLAWDLVAARLGLRRACIMMWRPCSGGRAGVRSHHWVGILVHADYGPALLQLPLTCRSADLGLPRAPRQCSPARSFRQRRPARVRGSRPQWAHQAGGHRAVPAPAVLARTGTAWAVGDAGGARIIVGRPRQQPGILAGDPDGGRNQAGPRPD